MNLNSQNIQLSQEKTSELFYVFTMDGGRWSNFFRLGMSIPLNYCHILYDYGKDPLAFFSGEGIVT